MRSIRTLAILLVLFSAGTVLAGPPKGAFPRTVEDGGHTLRLNGVGLCEWGVFAWNLYWGALYLEDKSSDPEKIIASGKAKSVHLHFVRKLTRKQMVQAYTAAVRVNAGKDLPKFQKGLDQLAGMLSKVEKGDTMVFTYLPGKGLVVKFNGTKKGTIADAEFCRLFFALYLGPKPPDKNLKKGMLGLRKKK